MYLLSFWTEVYVYMSFSVRCPASVGCNKNGIWLESDIYDLTVSVESARVSHSADVSGCEFVSRSNREASMHP